MRLLGAFGTPDYILQVLVKASLSHSRLPDDRKHLSHRSCVMYVRMCVCFHHSWGPTASAAPCLCAVHQVQLACDQALIRAVYDRGHTSSPFLQPLDSYSNPCLVWICSSRTQCTGSLCLSSVNTETSARAHGCCLWNHINTPGLFMSWLLMILKVLIIVVSHSGTYITTHLWLTDRTFLKSSKKIW